MGGSIGFSTPVATGAAVACPDRKVICMVGDGSAMYTIQSLWTQAREGLNVLTIVFANRIYQILRGEFDGVGAGAPGQRAMDMLKIDKPTLDFVGLAKSMGVAGRAVTTADEFNKALADSDRRARTAADRSADVSLKCVAMASSFRDGAEHHDSELWQKFRRGSLRRLARGMTTRWGPRCRPSWTRSSPR